MKEFRDDTKLHEELKQCCNYVYNPQNRTLPHNYKSIGIIDDNKNSGFYGEILQKGDTIILAIRSSELSSNLGNTKRDWIDNDIKMWINKEIPPQEKIAMDSINELINTYKTPPEKIIVTGHSLGGSITQLAVSQIPKIKGVAFCPYGTKDLLTDKNITNADNIINYCNINDIIARINAKNHLGLCYEIQTNHGNPHNIDTMQPLETRKLTLKTYLQNKESAFYTDNSNPKNKQIKQEDLTSQKEVQVDAYKRSNGTPVKEHTRSLPEQLKGKRLSEMNQEELNTALDYFM